MTYDYLPGTQIYLHQRKDMFRMNTDTALLGNFMKVKEDETVLEACREAGVFVINVDNVITEDDYDVVDGIIASNNHQLGYLSGKYVAEKATEGGKVLIVHLQTAESCAVNVQGFWDGLNENAAEGAKFSAVMNDFAKKINELGENKRLEDLRCKK